MLRRQPHATRCVSGRLLGTALGPFLVGLLSLASTAAHANGRIPGATGLAIHPTDDQQLLLGLTYGLALSRDGGASWVWFCEQQVEGAGIDVDPVMLMTGDGTLVVLSLDNGGVLVSRDDACTFEPAIGALQGERGVDLTLDPSQPSRVLALTSTVVGVTDAGEPRYRVLLAHSLDDGRTWEVLSELPDGIRAETLEVAASDANRIYVTGTLSAEPLQGVVERSDDGGLSWTRSTVQLPQGSGSMFVSAIHPEDPDRLWVRVPSRGDIYGVLPTSLWVSMDAGASFERVGDTKAGMLGFALSPDGDRIAFGGPLDGLLVAPSNASAAPSKVSDMFVSCLRWRGSGIYACALEPNSRFGLGLAAEPTGRFVPLWQRANSCLPTCAPPSPIEMRCREPWEQVAPLVDAATLLCDGSASMPDAGAAIDAGSSVTEPLVDAGDATLVDASPETPESTEETRARAAGGCAVSLPPSSSSVSRRWWPVAVLMLASCMRKLRRGLIKG